MIQPINIQLGSPNNTIPKTSPKTIHCNLLCCVSACLQRKARFVAFALYFRRDCPNKVVTGKILPGHIPQVQAYIPRCHIRPAVRTPQPPFSLIKEWLNAKINCPGHLSDQRHELIYRGQPPVGTPGKMVFVQFFYIFVGLIPAYGMIRARLLPDQSS